MLRLAAGLSVVLSVAAHAETPTALPETPSTAPAESVQTAPAEPEVAPAADTKALTAEIVAPPATDEEIDQRIAEVKEKLKALAPTTQPTTTAPAPGEVTVPQVSAQIFEMVSSYLAELTRWKASRARIRELGNRETIEQTSKELAEWREAAKTSRGKPVPKWRFQISKELETVEQDLNRWRTLLTPLKSLQTGRETQLANMPAKKEKADAAVRSSLQELEVFLKNMPAELDKAATQNQRTVLGLQKQVLEWKHNLALLRGAMIPDERTVLELETKQDADRIAALNNVVTGLYDYRSRLADQQSKSDSQYAAEQLQRNDLLPYERAYWEIVAAAAEGMTVFQQYTQSIYKRYPGPDHTRLETHILNGDLYWQRFVESLDRRPGEALTTAHQKLREQLNDYRRQLDDLQKKLDVTIEEQRLLLERRDQITEAIAAGQAKLESIISGLKDEQLTTARTRQSQLISETITKLHETIDAALQAEDTVQKRLTEATTMLQNHIEGLLRHRSQIYWAHLMVPGRGILRQEWSRAREELRWLGRREGPLEDRWRLAWANMEASVRAVGTSGLISGLLLVILPAWLGVRGRRRFMLRTAEQPETTEREAPPADAPEGKETVEAQTARARHVQHQLWRVVASSAPIAWPCAGLLAAVVLFRFPGDIFRIVAIMSIASLVGILGLASIRALFDPHHSQARIIPCDDDVARYHRRRLRLLLITAWVTLPLLLVLEAVDLLPALRNLAWDSVKLILLVLAFLYAVRRRMFTPHSPVSRYGWEAAIYVKIFPIFPTTFALLAALEVAAYGALTDYVLRGLFCTLIVLGTMKLLRSWIEAWVAVQHSAAAPVVTSEEPGGAPQVTVHPLLASGLQILRLLILIGAPVLVLFCWGISAVEINAALNYRLMSVNDKPLTAWRIVAVFMALGLAIGGSRALRTFLQTRVFPRSRHLDLGAQAAISTILHYAIIGFACYIALNLAHLGLGALTVLLGTLGLGLGLGLQPLFVNFISGLMILFERHIRVGDTVEVNGQLGAVSSIQMRSTNIKTFDGIELVIPNGDFVTGQVTNWTLSDRKLRARLPIGVAYGSDVELVRKILLDIAHRHESVLTDPAPMVWFMDLGDNALHFELVCWFGSPETRWAFLSQVRFEVVRLFNEHGIEIPFPQRTISVIGNRPIPVEMVDRRGRDLTGEGDIDRDNSPDDDQDRVPHPGTKPLTRRAAPPPLDANASASSQGKPPKESAASWKQESP